MKTIIAIASASLVFAASSGAVRAESVLFDFNALGKNVNSTNGADPIELYMENLWGSNITVVAGAKTMKNRPENPHPAGLYLGNSDGATVRGPYPGPGSHGNPKDTYLINRWNSGCCAATEKDRITIVFDEGINEVAFDWEIFPTNGANTTADFTFKADEVPYFFTALTTMSEKTQGQLGHLSFDFDHPVHRLEFIDWTDAPIGIDNLHVGFTVPGPSPLLALGLGLATLAGWRRLRARPRG